MADEILIGTEGWQHAAWRGRFYPEELPPEWEFCYYSNRLRAVSVPADAAAGATAADIAQWLQDSDPAFRFVLNVAATRAASGAWLAEFCLRTAVLKPRLAGVALTDIEKVSALEGGRIVQTLAALAPVCIDVPVAARATIDFGPQPAPMCVWYVDAETQPPWSVVANPEATLCLARMQSGSPRAIRYALEQLAAAPTATAGLLFTPSAAAPDYAEQARTLAELLGV